MLPISEKICKPSFYMFLIWAKREGYRNLFFDFDNCNMSAETDDIAANNGAKTSSSTNIESGSKIDEGHPKQKHVSPQKTGTSGAVSASSGAPKRKGGRPTLKDIAYITGLGVTTVSRALNDAPDIGKATKARVRLVAEQIGYRPNRAGVRLRTGKTNVISIILNTEDEILGMTASMLNGLAASLGETTYHLVVTPYNLDQNPLDPVKYVVETGSADGVILSRTQPNDARVRYLTEQNFPFATHGRTDMGLEHAYFDYDNKSYAAYGVSELVERGRKKIGLIAPPEFMTYSSHMFDGLHTELEKHNLSAVPIRNVTTDSTTNQIEAEILRIMMSKQPLDGIICASPHSAMAAIAAVETSRRVIGKDVDIVAKETFDLLNRFRPDLIVFEESFKKAGYALGNIIISIIKGDDPTKHQILDDPHR